MMLDDIAEHLADNGHGTVGTDIFLGHMPNAPANCMAIYQDGGTAPEVVGGIEHPRLIVRVRNESYSTGFANAQAVMGALHTEGELTINGHRYLYIRAVGSVNFLGMDERRRSLFSLDLIVTKEME